MSNIGNKQIMAKNLSYYVERSGKSQRELAEIVGVATSTFNDWVKGKKYPRIDKIEILANYFGILKSDLIEDKSAEPPDPVLDDALVDLLCELTPEEVIKVTAYIEGLIANRS